MRSPAVALAAVALLVTLAPVAVAQDKPLGQQVEDAAITALVKSKLVAARPGNFASIDVDTAQGVVRLHGTVPSESDKAEAERLALGTNGVARVVNDLRVDPRAAGADRDSGAASPATGFTARHVMTGEVAAVDAGAGRVDLRTPEGELRLHFPPAALRDVKPGDTLSVELALKPGS
jgi:hypothetical protein